MIKKLSMFVLLIGLMVPKLFAASGPCANPPTCILNGSFPCSTTGNLNGGATISGWNVSHGSPSVSGLTHTAGTKSIWMWSYSGTGEGVYTCFNFVRGNTYTVCLWVENTNLINAGNLYIVARNDLTNTGVTGTGVPTLTGTQLISNAYGGGSCSTTWVQLTYTFVASGNWNELQIYPYMAQQPIGGKQFELAIDDIAVSADASSTLSISATKSTISGCADYSTMTVSGAGSNTVTWYPATGLNTTTGTQVTARPCYTTTYTATINPSCPGCGTTTHVNYTVYVSNPISATHISNNSPVNCGGTISLSYSPTESCATYVWKDPLGNSLPGGASVSITNAAAANSGMYSLYVTYPNGCVYVLTTTVKVINCCTAKAVFTTSGCNPVTFNSTGSTTSSSGPVVSYMWDFGDGTPYSTLSNPVHTYAAAGTYTACLSIVVKDGDRTCCDRICKTIQVCAIVPCNITASFTANQLSSPATTMQFYNTSVGTGTLCSISWDFGDGTTSSATNPSHSYSAPGTYTVCVTVWNCVNSGGVTRECYSKICQQITVKGLPNCVVKPDFTATQLTTLPRTIQFADASILIAGESVCGYYWDFGDGTSSTAASPSHTYTASGVYNVCLDIIVCLYDANHNVVKQCEARICKQVAVKDQDIPCQAKAGFTFAPLIFPPMSIQFTSTSTGTGPICGYLWNFGDGTTSSIANPNHTYAANGSYMVCLTIWICNYDAKGNLIGECQDKICQPVVVGLRVSLDCSGTTAFTYLEVAQPAYTVNFTDQSTSNGTITDYSWSFGDQSDPSTDANPSHTYGGAGNYEVCETTYTSFYDDQGNPSLDCSNQTCQLINVVEPGMLGAVMKGGAVKEGSATQQGANSVTANPLSTSTQVSNISLTPNPAGSQMKVLMTGINNPTLTVTTIDGQAVNITPVKNNDGDYTLNLDGIKPGIYLVNVQGSNTSKSLRFVKH